jgi:hypothetical protein
MSYKLYYHRVVHCNTCPVTIKKRKKRKSYFLRSDRLTRHWLRRFVASSPLQQHASLGWSPINGSHWPCSGPTSRNLQSPPVAVTFQDKIWHKLRSGTLAFPRQTETNMRTLHGGEATLSPRAAIGVSTNGTFTVLYWCIELAATARVLKRDGCLSWYLEGTNQIDRLRACGTCQTRTLSPSQRTVQALAGGYWYKSWPAAAPSCTQHNRLPASGEQPAEHPFSLPSFTDHDKLASHGRFLLPRFSFVAACCAQRCLASFAGSFSRPPPCRRSGAELHVLRRVVLQRTRHRPARYPGRPGHRPAHPGQPHPPPLPRLLRQREHVCPVRG